MVEVTVIKFCVNWFAEQPIRRVFGSYCFACWTLWFQSLLYWFLPHRHACIRSKNPSAVHRVKFNYYSNSDFPAVWPPLLNNHEIWQCSGIWKPIILHHEIFQRVFMFWHLSRQKFDTKCGRISKSPSLSLNLDERSRSVAYCDENDNNLIYFLLETHNRIK